MCHVAGMEPAVLIDNSGSGGFVVEIAGHHTNPARQISPIASTVSVSSV